MKTPEIFGGQPRIISLLILVLYCLFGPYMEDAGGEISRPSFPKLSLVITLISITAFSIGFYYVLSIFTVNIYILFILAVTFGFISVISLMPSIFFDLLITIYQRRAPYIVRARCKQSPSCSEYMKLSINKYGFLKGGRLGWNRLLKCDGKEKIDWP